MAARIVIEDDSLDRLFVQTEPGTELVPVRRPAPPVALEPADYRAWRGTGPERGEYEDQAAPGRAA